jgi:hypothetical protein
LFTFWFMLSVLAIITTFGFGTAINMVFRRWWVSVVLFAVFSIYLFIEVGSKMKYPEWILYIIGLIGVVLSTWAVRALRKRGYALFS